MTENEISYIIRGAIFSIYNALGPGLLKSVEKLARVHHKQLLTYLKITKLNLGILVNFNVDNITSGIFRKVNNLE